MEAIELLWNVTGFIFTADVTCSTGTKYYGNDSNIKKLLSSFQNDVEEVNSSANGELLSQCNEYDISKITESEIPTLLKGACKYCSS